MLKWEKLLNANRIGDDRIYDFYNQRSEFQRDFDRIVFSSAFRRLQDKTQVFPMPASDFVHSRLTHSLEVSSVGRNLGNMAGEFVMQKERNLCNKGINSHFFGDIVAAASLAHDVGNPPFGHSGESAISDFFLKNTALKKEMNACQWADLTHYEGNAHGFRLLTNHHPNETSKGGLKLTYATLAAFLKYPKQSFISSKFNPNFGERASYKKFGFFQTEKAAFLDVVKNASLTNLINSEEEEMYYSRHPLAFLMEAADNICYRIIDLEDGFKLNYLNFDEIEGLLIDFIKIDDSTKSAISKYTMIKDQGEKVGYLRAKAINQLVNESMLVFMDNYDDIMNASFDNELTNLIQSNEILEGKIKSSNLYLYKRKPVIEIELAGYKIINGLLETFVEAALNPVGINKKIMQIIPLQFHSDESHSQYDKLMRIVDFVARMSDSYALNLYRKLTGQSLPSIG